MEVAGFERSVVMTFLEDAGVEPDALLERDVQRFVADGIRRMPIHLRVGVGLVSVLLRVGCLLRYGRAFGRLAPEKRAAAVRSWAASPVDPIRQYHRLIRSLVVFAANEFSVSPAGT
jgi:hypothetical protein